MKKNKLKIINCEVGLYLLVALAASMALKRAKLREQADASAHESLRSEERRVGKEC